MWRRRLARLATTKKLTRSSLATYISAGDKAIWVFPVNKFSSTRFTVRSSATIASTFEMSLLLTRKRQAEDMYGWASMSSCVCVSKISTKMCCLTKLSCRALTIESRVSVSVRLIRLRTLLFAVLHPRPSAYKKPPHKPLMRGAGGACRSPSSPNFSMTEKLLEVRRSFFRSRDRFLDSTISALFRRSRILARFWASDSIASAISFSSLTTSTTLKEAMSSVRSVYHLLGFPNMWKSSMLSKSPSSKSNSVMRAARWSKGTRLTRWTSVPGSKTMDSIRRSRFSDSPHPHTRSRSRFASGARKCGMFPAETMALFGGDAT
mmetsp:Transcript_47440/g.107550  ORF Transcript_47440/g.107550 Transcript_47440/m.107550 type:complete len:320 (-) Transcript_47440:846-1805(-)